MWDWAEGDQDDDLTENYPFPVPHIRELSSEYTIPGCDSDLNSSSSSLTDEDSAAVPSTKSQEPVISYNKSLNRSLSDSNLFQVTHRSNEQHKSYMTSGNSHTINVFSHGGAQQRSTRRQTVAKCVVVEPSDASQGDVLKARFKLQSKKQALQL